MSLNKACSTQRRDGPAPYSAFRTRLGRASEQCLRNHRTAYVQRTTLACLVVLVSACTPSGEEMPAPAASVAEQLDTLAESYVRTALAFGEHDASYVDAYYGPEEWRVDARESGAPIASVRRDAEALVNALQSVDVADADDLDRKRHATLLKRTSAMLLRMDMSEGRMLAFDDESLILFDATAPDYDAEDFEAVLAELDALLPGDESLAPRIELFREQFVIPPEQLDAVFQAAIEACRSRTLRYIDLPDNESFEIEYVTDQPWSGYNWYKGDNFSLIQINTDLPIYIGRAVDLGCHEGYPGHHTLNVLLEQNLVEQRGWVEYTVNPLYGPQSLISEGTANFGVTMAFPGDERVEFEKAVLFPLAGLDTDEADRYYEIQELLAQLTYAGNEAARDYLNGDIDEAAAIDWLVSYTLASHERAAQRIDFFETYRSYVINYNLGRDLVESYIEALAGDDLAGRWQAFEELLSIPFTPSDLRTVTTGQ